MAGATFDITLKVPVPDSDQTNYFKFDFILNVYSHSMQIKPQ